MLTRHPPWLRPTAWLFVLAGVVLAGCGGGQPVTLTQEDVFPAEDWRGFGVSVVGESLWLSGGIMLESDGWVGLPQAMEVDAAGAVRRTVTLPHSPGRTFFEVSKVVEVAGEVWILGTECVPPPVDDDTLGCGGDQIFRLFRLVGDDRAVPVAVELPAPPPGRIGAQNQAFYAETDGRFIYLVQSIGSREDRSSLVRLLRLDPAQGNVTEVEVPEGLRSIGAVCATQFGLVAAVPNGSFDFNGSFETEHGTVVTEPVTKIEITVMPAGATSWLPLITLPMTEKALGVGVACSDTLAAVAVSVSRQGEDGPTLGVDVTTVLAGDDGPVIGPTQPFVGHTGLLPFPGGLTATSLVSPRFPGDRGLALGDVETTFWVSDETGGWQQAPISDVSRRSENAEAVRVGEGVIDLRDITTTLIEGGHADDHEPGG